MEIKHFETLEMDQLENINGGRNIIKDYIIRKAIDVTINEKKPAKVNIPKNVKITGSYCYRG